MEPPVEAARAGMAGDEKPGAGADLVLAQVWWLLRGATEQVRVQAQAEGLLSVGHPLALGMELAACRAANLMSRVPADWWGPEHVPPGVLDSLIAAERLTRSVPIDAYPAGASDLVLQLCDLIAQARSVTGSAPKLAAARSSALSDGSGTRAARGAEQ